MHKRDYQCFPAQARCLLMINQAISMRMHKKEDEIRLLQENAGNRIFAYYGHANTRN